MAVRWRPGELKWGLAHPEVHGLGDALNGRIKAPFEPPPGYVTDDDRETYLIVASDDQLDDAQYEVDQWVSNRPNGSEPDADGFQKAFAHRPRTDDTDDDA
ncbi:hypothetical protein [Mycolicibacter arupensis]|uniref:Uncharacterized protein n=1 Tax=Mycolicibacter arupensis TaxID=342002 RepID=A0A5C7Y5M1_9MYCO|nr:hypothetical protein [Mycolicibacter arupensis]TXI56891.1 MAG: hypothetical protein E6Q54_09335 [Mycolicibacter arupensis]